MLPSAESLQTWLDRVSRDVLRLGTREHLIAARIRDEAVAQGWSARALGDALASALATDRDTWRELRRIFDAEFAPLPAPPPPRRWPRVVVGLLALGGLVLVLLLGLCGRGPGPGPDLGLPDAFQPEPSSMEPADLGAADLHPAPIDLGCYKQPVPQPDGGVRSTTNDEPLPVLPLPVFERILWALGLLLLGSLALFFLRLPSYLRRRLAELHEEQQLSAQRQKEQEAQQLAEGQKQHEHLVQEALASGAATRPQYRIDLQPPFGPDVVEDSATLLGRAFLSQGGRDLDIDATLHATIERGGMAQPMFLSGREVRDLCVLYDDTTTRPYLPGFLKLVERWARLGVRLSAYRFSRHPTTLTPVLVNSGAGAANGSSIELAELLRQHEGCSLLLFANRLVAHTPTRELDWPRTLRQAAVCAWLDPDPRLDAERDGDTRTAIEYLPRTLPRLPFTTDGILAAARYIGTPAEGVQVPPWSPPPALTEPDMARWVDVWLGLGALVPDAALNQLEVVRQKLLSDALPDPRSIGRLLERLTQLLGPSFSASKATIELSKPLRLQLLLKLFWNDRALFRRACTLLLDTIAAEPALQPDESPGLVHHQTRLRTAWYRACIALSDGQDGQSPLQALRGTASHESAQEFAELLTHIGAGTVTEPVLEVVSRPPRLTWQAARIPRLLSESALFAALLPLLLLVGLRSVKTWPGRTIAVKTTYQKPAQTQPDEQVICPNRPLVIDPEPQLAEVKPPPMVKPPASVAVRRPPPPKPSALPNLGVAAPTDLASSPPDLAPAELHPRMVPIPSGRFQMGSTARGSDDEQPQHEVRITVPFLLSATEVTQAHYEAVMGKARFNLAHFGEAPNRPVKSVSWYEAVSYCNALSKLEGLETCYVLTLGGQLDWPKKQRCRGYRLPTEAEWEYAARAGEIWEYAGSDKLDEIAWHNGNSGGHTHDVGTKKANRWKLHDMSGNVWEWVWDWYKDSYAGADSTDPTGPVDGVYRVVRGASYVDGAVSTRVANRDGRTPSHNVMLFGFRLARSNP